MIVRMFVLFILLFKAFLDLWFSCFRPGLFVCYHTLLCFCDGVFK